MAILLVLFLTLFANPLATSKSTRILGGQPAKENQFPYAAAVYNGDSFGCGGAIINDRFILTAAHCVANDPKTYNVMVGSITRDPPGIMHAVKEKYIHMKKKACVVDIALLELEVPLNFTKSVAPIEVFDEEVPVGAKVIISGWGRTDAGVSSNELNYLEVEIGEPEFCVKAHPLFRHDYVLCLAHKFDTGACYGDSGGPAEYKGKLVGETMCGIGGCGGRLPDAYQKVSYFRNWIKIIAFDD